ncbi:CBF/Mak21 family-domain-containing protein [Cantharellus anzutake]|uniref:CBF/Mak21 family-domain-containing protein n=1 Tax=Cantharellus anzutake TaxID=1750568 RepID=UPI00190574E1|nr:CBF/Mak21 family-domain-containing protein [Cantharellus anzutake]KAF8311673.1 CBF/Mak21 family-domain-containing protein [Cantharellus anzutake]
MSATDQRFVSDVLKSGTSSDRLSALVLLAQSSPMHNTRALEGLKAMAGKKGRDESLKALKAIVDWWIGGGAPDRKLKYFVDQPLTHPEVTDAHLTYWYFEDWLKKYFFSILQILEALSMDPLPYVRTEAMMLIYQLLYTKPEQEQNLLRVLVNKLGDTEKRVASRASRHVVTLLQHHPGMKLVIIREATELIFRPVAPQLLQHHSRYFSIITLNQIELSHKDPPGVTASLIDLYFKLFKQILDESGRNPQTVPTEDTTDKNDRKGRGRRPQKHVKGGKSKHSQPAGSFVEADDAHSGIISEILTGLNRAFPYASMSQVTLIDDHIDTLFRITSSGSFNVSIRALTLIHLILRFKPAIEDRFYGCLYESVIDSRLITTSKQAMWLNLAFKAIKADRNTIRVVALVKRFLQALTMHQPAFICGALYLLSQLIELSIDLRMMMQQSSLERLSGPTGKRKRRETQQPETNTAVQAYDPKKGNPASAHAETTCLWELIPLVYHYHPSVSLHAKQILASIPVTTSPDLALNTLSHFLDRFVYKKPKPPKPMEVRVMQPEAYASLDIDVGGVIKTREGIGGGIFMHGASGGGPVNEETFRNKTVEEIPVNELFFHRFFMTKVHKEQQIAKKAEKIAKVIEKRKQRRTGEEGEFYGDESGEHSDEDGASDDEVNEDEVWEALKKTMPGGQDIDPLEEDSDDTPNGTVDSEDPDEELSEAQNSNGDIDTDDADSDAAGSLDGAGAEDGSEGSLIESDVDLVDLSDVELPDRGNEDDPKASPSAFEPEDSEAVSGLRKPHASDKSKGGRKKRKLALPTFASYEDYAKLIEEGPEDDI